jgi:hypothetical protein
MYACSRPDGFEPLPYLALTKELPAAVCVAMTCHSTPHGFSSCCRVNNKSTISATKCPTILPHFKA